MSNIYKNHNENIKSIYSHNRADEPSSALYKNSNNEEIVLNAEKPKNSITVCNDSQYYDEKTVLIFNAKEKYKYLNLSMESQKNLKFSNTDEKETDMATPLMNRNQNKGQVNDEQINSVKVSVNTDSEVGNGNKRPRGRAKITAYHAALNLMNTYSYRTYENQLYRYIIPDGYWKLITESEAHRMLRRDIADIDRAVNWKTGETTEDRKKLFFTYKLALEYNELSENNGYYSQFKDFVFRDDKKTENEFQKILGLCLSDIRNLKYCFFLYGPSNTGKSVVLNLLKLLIGEEYCSSVSFSQMSNEFAVTQLIGKRLNISGEVSGATNKRLDIFKSLTGNDRITASFKCKDHFQFSNKCLLTFACNSFSPMISAEDTDSFMSRVIIFPFINAKPRAEWISNLEEKLFMDSKAIITDAIEGLRFLEKDNFQFIESKAMKRCKREFYLQNDSFTVFADKYIKSDSDSIASSESIRKAYTHFCHVEECPILNQNQWVPMMKMKYNAKLTIKSINEPDGTSSRIRAYKGIRVEYPADEAESFWK